MKNRVILTDYDGVCADWQYSFDNWMIAQGYYPIINHTNTYSLAKQYNIPQSEAMVLVRIFNESPAILSIPVLRDAQYYINKLHTSHNFVFHCITSLSAAEHAIKFREENLISLFGSTAFEKLICLETGADKDNALAQYKDTECYFIEDNIQNAEAGERAGLRPILVEHGYNLHCNRYPRVKTWEEIYKIITQ